MQNIHLVVRLMLKRIKHWAAYRQRIYHTHHAGSRESSNFLEWCNSCLMNNSSFTIPSGGIFFGGAEGGGRGTKEVTRKPAGRVSADPLTMVIL